MNRLLCWLFGHDWRTDLVLFAGNRECTIRCARCERAVLCGPWRRG